MSESLYHPVAGLSVGGNAPAHITTLEQYPRLRSDVDVPFYGAVLLAIGQKMTTIDQFPTDIYWKSGTANLNYVQQLLRGINSDLMLPLGVCVLPSDKTHPVESTFFLLRGMGIHGLNVVNEIPGVCGIHTTG